MKALTAASALIVGLVASLSAQQARPPQAAGAERLEAIPVRGNIYLIGGAGSNIVVSAGPDGVFLVDSGLAQNADRVLAALNDLQERLQRALPAQPRAG